MKLAATKVFLCSTLLKCVQAGCNGGRELAGTPNDIVSSFSCL